MSIANLPTDQIVTRVIQYIADSLALCGFTTCKTVRWHAEPERLYCCECKGNDSSYTVVGWLQQRFDGDGLLAKARNFQCPRLDVFDVQFTIARCWPQVDNDLIASDPRDAVSAELLQVLDCLSMFVDGCVDRPNLFDQTCSRIAAQGWTAVRTCTNRQTPNNVTITDCCAGWKGSLLIA